MTGVEEALGVFLEVQEFRDSSLEFLECGLIRGFFLEFGVRESSRDSLSFIANKPLGLYIHDSF